MIDTEGYRPNVGIILFNPEGELFWARRIGEDAWQFPQGGIKSNESPEDALYRELSEEVGLKPEDVELIACTSQWLRYRLPKHLLRRRPKDPFFVGQKQRWYLLKLVCNEGKVCLSTSTKPEFDHWRWVQPQVTLDEVVAFKRQVYQQALQELIPMMDTVAAKA